MPTRRNFLQWAATGLAMAVTGRSYAADAVAWQKQAGPKRAYDLGIASYTVHRFPLDKALEITTKVGLKHFCLHPLLLPLASPPEAIAATVAKINAAGLDLYACGVVYMKTQADVEQAFEYAKATGAKLIVGVPMPELLPLVNEKVQKDDIGVAIHNHGPGDKVYPTPSDAYNQIKDLDRRIGLCIDIGHTARSGIDPCVAVEQCADRLLDVHIKDINEAAASGRCIEAGRGVLNIPMLIRTLDGVGYSHCVSFEYEKDMDAPLPGLAESVGYVRGVMAAL